MTSSSGIAIDESSINVEEFDEEDALWGFPLIVQENVVLAFPSDHKHWLHRSSLSRYKQGLL